MCAHLSGRAVGPTQTLSLFVLVHPDLVSLWIPSFKRLHAFHHTLLLTYCTLMSRGAFDSPRATRESAQPNWWKSHPITAETEYLLQGAADYLQEHVTS